MSRTVVLLAMSLVLGATACSEVEQAAEQAEQAASEFASEAGRVASEFASEAADPGQRGTAGPGGQDGAGQQGAGQDGGEGGGAGGAGDEAGAQQTPADDLGGVGANGPAMLRADYPRLVIEIDVQEGLEPDGGALDHLTSVLGSVVDKPDGIATAGGNTFSSDTTTWTTDDLRAVAEANRDEFSGDGQVVVYVLYVRGQSENENALGVAYNASEFALFPERWQGNLSNLLGGSGNIERAVLVHEAGHLFGLVNLTYDSQFSRESEDHPGHSEHRESVMYYAIETTAIGQAFSGPPPSDFDDEDRADLEFLRTGSY